MIDGVSPVSGASRVARSRLAREGALIFYWDLGGYQRTYMYIMPHSGCWLVVVSPYEAGGGLRRARGRRGCAGECAINCCHHHQTWPNRDKCAVRHRQKSWKQESSARDGDFARVVCSGAASDSGLQHIVRIVAARCIWPSITYPGVRAAIMCKIRKCALLRRRRVVSCWQSSIHSQSVFEAPGVLSGRMRRAPRAQNRP